MTTQLALILNDEPVVEVTTYAPKEVAFVKPFEQQLATIEGEYSKFVFDYADKEQNESARSLIAKLRRSKAAIEKAGKTDGKSIAKALHGLTISAKKYPGIILDVTFDDKGDIDRDSFLVEVKNGRQVVVATLPPLGKK